MTILYVLPELQKDYLERDQSCVGYMMSKSQYFFRKHSQSYLGHH